MRNALQTILGALGGGLEGQAAQRAYEDEQRRMERDRLDRLAREAAASERQTMLDTVALAEKGYMEQGERAETVKRATPALQDALTNMTSAMRGQAPTRSVDMGAIMNAAGQYGAPVSSVNIGGKTFERAQTPEQERQMLVEQTAQAKRGERQEMAREKSTALNAALDEATRTVMEAYPKLNRAQARMVADKQADASDFPAYAKPDRSGSLTPLQATERADQQNEQEAMGNVFLEQNRQNPQVINAIGTLLASNPTFRARPGLAGFAVMQQQAATAKTENTEAQVSQREAAAEAARKRTENIGKTGNDYLSRVRAERAGAQTTPTTPTVDKDTQRADRWDAIKAANPNMSDDAITAQVMREIP